jgi:hypothetical protein
VDWTDFPIMRIIYFGQFNIKIYTIWNSRVLLQSALIDLTLHFSTFLVQCVLVAEGPNFYWAILGPFAVCTYKQYDSAICRLVYPFIPSWICKICNCYTIFLPMAGHLSVIIIWFQLIYNKIIYYYFQWKRNFHMPI